MTNGSYLGFRRARGEAQNTVTRELSEERWTLGYAVPVWDPRQEQHIANVHVDEHKINTFVAKLES